ncbi:MAG: GNAT family N-acetyltransferase [Chitinophagaceae bacterium]
MVSFQQLTPADAEMLAHVGGVSLLESHGHSAPPEVMQAYVDRSFSVAACRAELSDNRNIFYALYYHGEPAGYFKTIYSIPHQSVAIQPVTKLERLYVLNKFLDKKLGQLLLQKSVELSKEAGEQGMWLNVWKKNERAIRFYQKQGFENVGESMFVLTETHANPNWVLLLRY